MINRAIKAEWEKQAIAALDELQRFIQCELCNERPDSRQEAYHNHERCGRNSAFLDLNGLERELPRIQVERLNEATVLAVGETFEDIVRRYREDYAGSECARLG
jgi:hypothetical protein